MARTIIHVALGHALVWPQVCVLCLNEAIEEVPTTLAGWPSPLPIPYCASCRARVERFTKWKESMFMLSVIFGAIGGLVALIGIVVQDGWAELLRVGNTLFMVTFAFLIFFGIFYALLWILLLPMRLIFRSKLAAPGVERLRTSDPVSAPLKFAKVEYAERFAEVNPLF
ncbi:MAG TPA: hypothetical protein G4O08_01035 [Anaerolineae bacterium]|nr:hypothetical protein [Anaerolineae bacterium]